VVGCSLLELHLDLVVTRLMNAFIFGVSIVFIFFTHMFTFFIENLFQNFGHHIDHWLFV
jgi:hypothetical protein